MPRRSWHPSGRVPAPTAFTHGRIILASTDESAHLPPRPCGRARAPVGLAAAALLASAAALPASAQVTTRISVDSAGAEADSSSADPDVSADGRFVVFESSATNLVIGDTNGQGDAFVHDRLTGITERVSVSSTGVEGDLNEFAVAISADGRYVAMASNASNLVPGDTNDASDIFVFDRTLGTMERVSVSSAGLEGDGTCLEPAISGDGNCVFFASSSTNLVPGDTNAQRDVFVRDVALGTT